MTGQQRAGVRLLAMPPFELLSVWILAVCGAAAVSGAAVEAAPKGASFGFVIQDVEVNTTVALRPVYLEGSDAAAAGIVAAGRFRIRSWSRLQHVDKFYYTFRVKIEAPPYRSSGGASKVDVCFNQEPWRSLGDCRNGSWRAIEAGGSWTVPMSPFQEKFVDVRVAKAFSAPSVTISVQDEESSFRLVLLGIGVLMLAVAPLVSAWLPFYYGTAMTLGIITVVLVIIFQCMKLLPTGRKSSFYILLYGSLAGLGTVVLGYFSSLVSSIMWELGFGEDLYGPVAAFIGLGISLVGAWLGFLGVRKLVMSEDGRIDQGIAQFVKWALRMIGYCALWQASSDYIFSALALSGGVAISWALFNVWVPLLNVWDNLQDLWGSESMLIRGDDGKKAGKRQNMMTRAQIDAIRRLPGTEALVFSKKGLVHQTTEGSTPGARENRFLRAKEVFPSTFHHSPGQHTLSKQEYERISRECTERAIDELMRSKEHAAWKQDNKERIFVAPMEHREERPMEEIEWTAYSEEETPRSGIFGRRGHDRSY